MDTRTVTQEVFFNALNHEIFEAFIDSEQHAEFTGAPAQIDRRPGGVFSVFDGAITGKTLEIENDNRIVQAWHAKEWPSGHFSQLTLNLTSIYEGRGTRLSLEQIAVPAQAADDISKGWQVYYWGKLAEYLRARKIAPVRKFLEEFKNHTNIDVVDETWTADCLLHVPGMTLPRGRDAQKNVGRTIFAAFSNVHVEVNDTIVEGDRVVERHTATAVHKGEFMGIPASGKMVSWTENHIYRIADGKIAEAWSEVSFHDLLKQIAPAKDTAAA